MPAESLNAQIQYMLFACVWLARKHATPVDPTPPHPTQDAGDAVVSDLKCCAQCCRKRTVDPCSKPKHLVCLFSVPASLQCGSGVAAGIKDMTFESSRFANNNLYKEQPESTLSRFATNTNQCCSLSSSSSSSSSSTFSCCKNGTLWGPDIVCTLEW